MKLIPYVPEESQPEQSRTSEISSLNIETLAWELLESHPHFRHHCDGLGIAWVDQCLVLSGNLPSFHLKQVLQEAFRGMKVQVVNQIEVVCSDGLSSSHRMHEEAISIQVPPRKPR